jgi:ABC-type multidrug transport system fused ATPase/permease subunit
MPTLDLIQSLANVPEIENSEDALDLFHKNFVPNVEIKNVSLKYPSKITYALKNITLTIGGGESIAIVGPSGAGKTTLVDVILGVLKPESGTVFISGKIAQDAITTWPGAIAYVPQDVRISNGSFRENIALGYPLDVAKDSLIWEALDTSQLTEFVKELPQEIDTQVGERGTKISGGQRQRLGIARAMFTKPKLLVLDEATSSLDGQTESNISEAINKLKGSVTVIVVAHRLSTVRNCDKVIYISNGEILCQGTFEQVRESVPDFDTQAQMMGL